MGTTPTYSLPYPELTDTADVPRDVKALALGVDGLPSLGWWTAYDASTIMTTKNVEVRGWLEVGDASNGVIYFGLGFDTNMYRQGAGALATNGSLTAGSYVAAASGANQSLIGDVAPFIGGAARGGIAFGNAYDAALWRQSASEVRAHQDLTVTRSLGVNGGNTTIGQGATMGGGNTYNAGNNWMSGYAGAGILWDGTNWVNRNYGGNNGWGMVSFNGAVGGLNFFADAATGAVDRTYTPAQMMARRIAGLDNAGNFFAQVGLAGQVAMGAQGPGNQAGLRFGNAADTNLYRVGASMLKTDGQFLAAGSISTDQTFSSHQGGVGGTAFVADSMGASSYLLIGRRTGDAQWRFLIDNNGGLSWGDGTNAADTTLGRPPGANQLSLNGDMLVGKNLVVDHAQGGRVLYFGGQFDTYLYRGGANILSTSGRFQVNSDGGNVIFMGALTNNQPASGSANGLRVMVNGVTYRIALYADG